MLDLIVSPLSMLPNKVANGQAGPNQNVLQVCEEFRISPKNMLCWEKVSALQMLPSCFPCDISYDKALSETARAYHD
jgi:hypothetical protein